VDRRPQGSSGRLRVLMRVDRVRSMAKPPADYPQSHEEWSELKIDVGPGLPVYYRPKSDHLLLLLAGQ